MGQYNDHLHDEIALLRTNNSKLTVALQTVSEMGTLVGVSEKEFADIADTALKGVDRMNYDNKEENAACPFCGDGGHLELRGEFIHAQFYWVACGACLARGPKVSTEVYAKYLWNKGRIQEIGDESM